MSSLTRRFLAGVGLLLTSFRMMLRTPSLWPWIILPILVTMFLLTGAAWWTWGHAEAITLTWFPRPRGDGLSGALSALAWRLTNGVVHVATFVLLAISAWVSGNVLASPFYERMSARVEAISRDRVIDEPWDTRQVLIDLLTSIGHTIACLALWLAIACPAALLNLLPVVGQVAGLVIGTSVAGFFMAREVMDHAASRRRYPLRRKLGMCWENLPEVLGLGVGIVLLLSVPLANFFSMPAAVIGGTLLFLDLEERAAASPADVR